MDDHQDLGTDDPLALVAELVRLGNRMPKGTVAAEFATFGPVLNLLIGGRDGAQRYREGVELDDEQYIPLYQRTLAALLSGVLGESALLRLVDLAVAQDRHENANLLAAFALLDPADGQPPKVLAATRYTAPAAAHAAAKFALLIPALIPASAVVLRHRRRRARQSG